MENKYKLELCCENVEQALASADQVDQIEFCADLENDGLTPDVKDVLKILQRTNTPIKVMIRNRKGDFVYNKEDIRVMYDQASKFKEIGIINFVFGAILEDRLDIKLIKDFAKFVFPAKVCVHKAIDLSNDIIDDTKKLLKIENVNEILSSGGKATAEEGVDKLTEMIQLCGNQITVISAGKITFNNIEEIHAKIHGKIYHGKRIISSAS